MDGYSLLQLQSIPVFLLEIIDSIIIWLWSGGAVGNFRVIFMVHHLNVLLYTAPTTVT
jgi:hypothetical protein